VDDLVKWLRAQLDDDERIAREATPGPWWYNPGKQWLGPEAFEKYDLRQGEEFVGYGGPHPFTGAVSATGPANNPQSMRDAEFIAEHDPARALREIDTKRRLLEWLVRKDDWALDNNLWTWDSDEALCLLALPYADRPGYREEWRP